MKIFYSIFAVFLVCFCNAVFACDADPGCTCRTDEQWGIKTYQTTSMRLGRYYLFDGANWSPDKVVRDDGIGETIYSSYENDASYYLGISRDCTNCEEVTQNCGSNDCTHPDRLVHHCSPCYHIVKHSFDGHRYIASYYNVDIRFIMWTAPDGHIYYFPFDATLDGERVQFCDTAEYEVPDFTKLLAQNVSIIPTGERYSRYTPVAFRIPSGSIDAKLEYSQYSVDGKPDNFNVFMTVPNPQFYGNGEKTYVFGRQPLLKLPEEITGDVYIRASYSDGLKEYYTSHIWIKLEERQKGLK